MAVHARRRGHRRPGRRDDDPGPEAGPFAGGDGRADLGRDAGRPGGTAPAEGQLSPARPGEARPGGGRGTTQVGRIDRAPAGSQGGLVRRLAGGARPDRERPGPNARSSVRRLSDRAGRTRRPGSEPAPAAVAKDREAACHSLDRHRDPLPNPRPSAPRAAGSSPRRWPDSSRAITTNRRRGAAGIAW